MPTITVLPDNKTIEIKEGQSIFEAAKEAKVDVDTACVGKGTCGLCRVKIVEGHEHLNEQSDAELRHLGNVYFITKVRLACQTKATGDVTIEVLRKKKKAARQSTLMPKT